MQQSNVQDDDFYPAAVDANADGGLFYQHVPVSSVLRALDGIVSLQGTSSTGTVPELIPFTGRVKTELSASKSKKKPKKEVTTKSKLRLLVTTKCHNDCPLCCNKQFDFKQVQVVDRWNYDEVCITGGEPLMTNKMARNVIMLIDGIRAIWSAQGRAGKIYIYTATHRGDLLRDVLHHVDGIVYTIHNMQESNTLQHFIYDNSRFLASCGKSLRLNYFKGEEQYLPRDPMIERFLSNYWTAKELEWIPNCTVPEGEDFRKLAILF